MAELVGTGAWPGGRVEGRVGIPSLLVRRSRASAWEVGPAPPGCEAAARQEDPPPARGPEPGPLQHSPSVRTLAAHTHQHSHSHHHTDTCWSVPALPPPLLPPSPPSTIGVGKGAPGAPFSIAGARPRWSEAVPGSDTDGRHAAVCARRAPPR